MPVIKWPLRLIGILTIVLAIAAILKIVYVAVLAPVRIHSPPPHFWLAFAAISLAILIANGVLAWCGYFMLRARIIWLVPFVAVCAALYFLPRVIGHLWSSKEYGMGVAAATGITLFSIAPQQQIFFFVWVPILVLLLWCALLKWGPDGRSSRSRDPK